MHFQVRNDPDMREKSVRDAFARGEMILIRGKILAGMHLRGKSDPDSRENSGRDAFARGK